MSRPGDDLPTSTAFLPGGHPGRCPVCAGPALQAERYPAALCAACTGAAVCRAHGLPAALGGEASLSGGLVPGHVGADGQWEPCGDSGLVLVRGRPCRLQEARFGGAVVEPDGG